MTLPGLVAAQNLADVVDRERAWDNLGLTISYPLEGFEPEAISYINAVAVADGQPLEVFVAIAVNNFIVGCKSDGIWTAIKASCILAGARTLTGALVPLVGTAPTNFNFASGDYNRKTGLLGNGSTKYLSTNQTYAQLTTQNNGHISCHVTADATSSNKVYIGGYQSGGVFRDGGARLGGLINSATFSVESRGTLTTGFIGVRRNNNANQQFRRAGGEITLATNSVAPLNDVVNVFTVSPILASFNSAARLAFYSAGESLDLALLDARIVTLINAFAASIP